MAIVRTRDKVADDLDNSIIIGELYEDGEVRDDKGNVIEPFRGFVNGKAVKLYFTPANKKLVTLDKLEEIAEEAEEDEEYRTEILHAAEKQAKKAESASDGRRKYGSGPTRNDTKHIREWLRSQGVEISDRGRIPTDLMGRYNGAHPGSNAKSTAVSRPAFSSSSDERGPAPQASKVKARPGKAQLLKHHNDEHGTKLKSLTEEQEDASYESYVSS